MNGAGPVGLRYACAGQPPQPGYVQQYRVNIERQPPYDFTAQLGYAGSRGLHLPCRVDDANTVQPIHDAPGYGFKGPSARGRRTITLVPAPTVLAISMLPPALSQIDLQMARPSPVPPVLRSRA